MTLDTRICRRLGAAARTACLGLIIAAGCAPVQSGPAPVEEQAWTSPVGTKGSRLLTPHYDIRVTSQDGLLKEYLPAFMEAANREYRRLLPPARDSGEPLVIYVFGRRQEWAAFTRGFVPAQADVYLHIHDGGYMDHATGTAVMWDISRDRTLSLIAHEGLHQYLSRQFPHPLPAWLNEGLATQFEDFDLDGPIPTFRPRRNLMRKPALREALLADYGLLPMQQLLNMDAGEAVTRTGQPARGYYAQVWLTVLYLREEPRYRAAFQRLLADAGADRLRAAITGYRAASPAAGSTGAGEILFRQYITEDLEGFLDDCRTYARQLVN
jgi:hypothetical protein